MIVPKKKEVSKIFKKKSAILAKDRSNIQRKSNKVQETLLENLNSSSGLNHKGFHQQFAEELGKTTKAKKFKKAALF